MPVSGGVQPDLVGKEAGEAVTGGPNPAANRGALGWAPTNYSRLGQASTESPRWHGQV